MRSARYPVRLRGAGQAREIIELYVGNKLAEMKQIEDRGVLVQEDATAHGGGGLDHGGPPVRII
jgi:hypothetical protein